MLNRPLEDILWEDFGRLQKTLQGNGYQPRRVLDNHYVLYELRPPEPGCPGTYFAVRKSAGGSVENAIIGTAADLQSVCSATMSLPSADGPIKPEQSLAVEALKLGAAVIVSTGASLIIYGYGPHALLGGFLIGMVAYSIGRGLQKNLNADHQMQPLPSSAFTVLFNGKEAVRDMLQLTEIFYARV